LAITDLPILSMLRTRLQWHQERQRILAENVSNSDTGGFRPRDLAPPKFDQQTIAARNSSASTVGLARTEPGHIAGMGLSGSSQFRSETSNNYEVRPTGNAVSLEDEMMKVASNQMDFQAATALYSRSLGLIKTALGKR
jgi:flagellar basal-body rod protein FlgB